MSTFTPRATHDLELFHLQLPAPQACPKWHQDNWLFSHHTQMPPSLVMNLCQSGITIVCSMGFLV